MGHIHGFGEEIFDDIPDQCCDRAGNLEESDRICRGRRIVWQIKRLEGAVEAITFCDGESVELGQIKQSSKINNYRKTTP